MNTTSSLVCFRRINPGASNQKVPAAMASTARKEGNSNHFLNPFLLYG
ncbi:hypothetical protein [Paenibacillus pectinilyticus]|nr:hypothetical protein [Paenibacillus pectinilyticus]